MVLVMHGWEILKIRYGSKVIYIYIIDRAIILIMLNGIPITLLYNLILYVIEYIENGLFYQNQYILPCLYRLLLTFARIDHISCGKIEILCPPQWLFFTRWLFCMSVTVSHAVVTFLHGFFARRHDFFIHRNVVPCL